MPPTATWTPRRLGAACLILALVAAATYFFGRGPLAEPATVDRLESPVPRPPQPVPQGPPADDYEEVPMISAPRVEKPAREGMLRLPDGTFVEPLNGVEGPPPLKWTKGPYAPIVGKRRGKEPGSWWWYVHADGTFSTTATIMRHALGRPDKVTIVAHPEKALSIYQPELDALDQQQQSGTKRPQGQRH